jgi:hypothetical protein
MGKVRTNSQFTRGVAHGKKEKHPSVGAAMVGLGLVGGGVARGVGWKESLASAGRGARGLNTAANE